MIIVKTIGKQSPPASFGASSARTVIFDWYVGANATIKTVRAYAVAAGTIKVKRFTRSGLALTFQDEIAVTLAAGLNAIDVSGLSFGPFDCLGFYWPDGVMAVNTSASAPCDTAWFYGGGSDFTSGTVMLDGNPANEAYEYQIAVDLAADYGEPFAPAALESLCADEITGPTVAELIVPVSPQYAVSSSVYLDPSPVTEASALTRIVARSGVACRLNWYVTAPDATGLLLTQAGTLRLASGINTFIAGADFPNLIVPKGARFGFHALNTGSNLDGLYANPARRHVYRESSIFTAPPALGSPWASNPDDSENKEFGIRFETRAAISEREIVSGAYSVIASARFAGGPPAGFKKKGTWTFAGAEARTGGVGINDNFVESFATCYYSRTVQRTYFTFTSDDAEVAFYRRPRTPVAFDYRGTVCSVRLSDGRMRMWYHWDGGSLLSTAVNDKTCALTLTKNRPYLVETIANDLTLILRITDLISGASDELTWTDASHGFVLPHGLMLGRAGVCALAGTASFTGIDLTRTGNPQPSVLFVGDSLSDFAGSSSAANCWTAKAVAQINGNGIICARGGAKVLELANYLDNDMRPTPSLKYVVILIGTNDTDATDYAIQMDRILARARAFGATPLICIPPPDLVNQPQSNGINAGLLARTGERFIRFDLALSVNNDGVTRNMSYDYDGTGVHFNDAGHLVQFNRLRLDSPDLFQ